MPQTSLAVKIKNMSKVFEYNNNEKYKISLQQQLFCLFSQLQKLSTTFDIHPYLPIPSFSNFRS